jgi:competence ComEA-like helix-hairpin-helix protein
MFTKKLFLKISNFRILTCLFVFAFFMLGLGSVSTAEEEKLVGKTVNINTATVEQWMQVPLITKELAERIVEYREAVGDFMVLEELLQVEGFTRKMLRRLKPFLLLEGLGGDDCTC